MERFSVLVESVVTVLLVMLISTPIANAMWSSKKCGSIPDAWSMIDIDYENTTAGEAQRMLDEYEQAVDTYQECRTRWLEGALQESREVGHSSNIRDFSEDLRGMPAKTQKFKEIGRKRVREFLEILGSAESPNQSYDRSEQYQPNSSSDDCSSIPMNCQRANDRATALLQQVQAGQLKGITDSSSQLYCMALVGIEVNNLCAVEYANAGRSHCASALRQQVEQYRSTAESAAQTASAVSVANARNRCSFE